MKRTLFLTVLALVACSAGTPAARNTRATVTHTVTIDGASFSPAALTIDAGDTVIWVNKDLIAHTATSKKKGSFDSGTIASGASWKHTFESTGELAYVCLFHPKMEGTLRIK